MAKLTLSKIPDDLLARLKQAAEQQGVSVQEHVIALLAKGDADRWAPDPFAGSTGHVGASAQRAPAFDELHATSPHGREYDL